MNIKFSTAFLFLVLLFFANKANAKVDSLQQAWLDDSYPDSSRFKAINVFYEDKTNAKPSTVLEWAKRHYNLALQKNSKTEMANAINQRVLALRIIGSYDKALIELDTLVKLNKSQNDTIGLASSYRQIGVVYHFKSQYLEAVNFFLKSLNLFQQKKNDIGQAKVLSNLANVYSEINTFDMAMECFDEANQIFQKLGQEKRLNINILNSGFTHFAKKDYAAAITNSNKTKLFFQSTNHQVGLADCYYLMAESFQALSRIDSALYYVNKSLEINLSIGNPGQIIPTKLLLADILFESDIAKATRIGEELLPIINTSFGYTYLTQVHHLLYKCYKTKGNLPLALKMHEKYTRYNDSLLIEEDNIVITRQALETKYKIELLNKELENEKTQSALKFSQIKRTFAILLGSIFIIFLLGFYARLNILNQRREKEGLLNEIQQLKSKGDLSLLPLPAKFQLERQKIEESINRKINETDWKVLNILLDNPVISNKDIAKQAFLTVDGIGSCLRRMYLAFEIKESKYKKISLIMKAIKISNTPSNPNQITN